MEQYEFMNTKFFGLIYAIFIFAMIAIAMYRWGYWKGQVDEGQKQKVLFVLVQKDGTPLVIDNLGQKYRLTDESEEE